MTCSPARGIYAASVLPAINASACTRPSKPSIFCPCAWPETTLTGFDLSLKHWENRDPETAPRLPSRYQPSTPNCPLQGMTVRGPKPASLRLRASVANPFRAGPIPGTPGPRPKLYVKERRTHNGVRPSRPSMPPSPSTIALATVDQPSTAPYQLIPNIYTRLKMASAFFTTPVPGGSPARRDEPAQTLPYPSLF